MAARFPRSLVCVVAIASILSGCATYNPEPMSARSREAVDVGGEHPIMNGLSSICTDREVMCILAGFALFGGTIAILKGSND